jgi:hypothetical protein
VATREIWHENAAATISMKLSRLYAKRSPVHSAYGWSTITGGAHSRLANDSMRWWRSWIRSRCASSLARSAPDSFGAIFSYCARAASTTLRRAALIGSSPSSSPPNSASNAFCGSTSIGTLTALPIESTP